MQVSITFRKITSPIQPNLQKCQLFINEQPLPIYIERLPYGFRVRGEGEDFTIKFDLQIADKEERVARVRSQATLIAKGIAMDIFIARLAIEEEKKRREEEAEKERQAQAQAMREIESKIDDSVIPVIWKFYRNKFRVYQEGTNKNPILSLDDWHQIQVWAKQTNRYKFVMQPEVYSTNDYRLKNN